MNQNSTINLIKSILSTPSLPGILLLLATIIALIVANSPIANAYHNVLHVNILSLSVHEWVNDVLMVLFFFGVGLEIKKEMLIGNLASIKGAAFPIIAALGGMIVPALIYIVITAGSPFSHGFGIPMATDIAFAIGVLILLGKKVPNELKVFLLTLAVADDLGAIIIIALFYSKGIVALNLLFAFLIFIILVILNKLNVRHIFIYLIGGVFLWYFIFNSGIHATIAGVLLAFTIPLRGYRLDKSPLIKTEHILAPLSAFLIMPIFAFFNAGVSVGSELNFNSLSFAIMLGLFAGKPIGVLLFTFLSTKLNIASKPKILGWGHILAAGMLAGIGFTMSIFISTLTFEGATLDNAKLSVLISSLVAAICGSLYFKLFVSKNKT